MLALVKKPHIELSIQGDRVEELVAWIRKKYELSVLSREDVEGSIPVEETEFWKQMDRNRVGNLLAAARLKAGLTQGQLAKKLGIRQNMISDYERGRRSLSPGMAARFSDVLHIKRSHLKRGANSRPGMDKE